MLLVPEIKSERSGMPPKALSESEIQQRLYGLKPISIEESGIHPQLAQAKVRIVELEEEVRMNDERVSQLYARIKDLEHEKKEFEKKVHRSQKEQERLEQRISSSTNPQSTHATTFNWQKVRSAVQNSVKTVQRFIPRRPKA